VTVGEAGIVLAHALIGWVLCGATMAISLAKTSPNRALTIHAVAAPGIFTIVSAIYFTYFAYTSRSSSAVGTRLSQGIPAALVGDGLRSLVNGLGLLGSHAAHPAGAGWRRVGWQVLGSTAYDGLLVVSFDCPPRASKFHSRRRRASTFSSS
jgi:hypothetical protein